MTSTADSVILVNIGNTHTQIVQANAGKLGMIERISTSELTAEIFPESLPLAVASVAPAATARLRHRPIFEVNAQVVPRLDWHRVDTATLGADRIANAVMLAASSPLPGLCVDCGTAITVETVIDGVFQGGCIAPGRLLMRRALHDYTAQLPMLDLTRNLPEQLGCNTVDAMTQGIDLGAIGIVRELVALARRQLGDRLRLVAVGGDREFFLRRLPELTDGGDDFTLQGILKIWEMNHAS